MTPWWLVMFGGFLGSSHCIGMCGGFAAMVGLNTGSFGANLRAQLIYSCGRLMSYATLGAAAGFAGKRLMETVPGMVNVPAILCLMAGAFLIREGVLAAGWWPGRVSGSSTTGCLLGSLFASILKLPGARNAFVAGIVTGLLPCGLVYSFVSLAASSGDLLQGAVTMLSFGAGTIPLMVATGCGASTLSWSARQRLWKFAAASVVLTGLLTLGRGAAFLHWPNQPAPAGCPFCASKSSPVPATPETLADRSTE